VLTYISDFIIYFIRALRDALSKKKAYTLFIRKWQIVRNRHSSIHILRRNTEYYGCKKWHYSTKW